jgi:UDP-N-acetylglucosamine 2-epimerase (non-hydrolysing)
MIDTLRRELSEARALRYAATLGLEPQSYAVVTLHRPSNVDDAEQLEALMAFLLAVSERLKIVFPVHPRTRARLEQAGWLDRLTGNPAFRILPPVSYRENLSLLADARLVLTDSGGIQEETSSLSVPCLTLRKNTERPITVSEGTNTLVGGDLALAMKLVGDILAGTYKPGAPIRGWDGRASERVLDALEEMLGPA